MIEKEKVIIGLREMTADPWLYEHADYYALIAHAALELLKEQEPVEPIPPTDETDLWRCGNCNHQLFRCTHQRYCEICGLEVKWK